MKIGRHEETLILCYHFAMWTKSQFSGKLTHVILHKKKCIIPHLQIKIRTCRMNKCCRNANLSEFNLWQISEFASKTSHFFVHRITNGSFPVQKIFFTLQNYIIKLTFSCYQICAEDLCSNYAPKLIGDKETISFFFATYFYFYFSFFLQTFLSLCARFE